jgi:hypothetical protein
VPLPVVDGASGTARSAGSIERSDRVARIDALSAGVTGTGAGHRPIIEDGGGVVEQLPRHVAPGGVRRLIIGFACGLLAGAIIALVLPRDDGPRRRTLRFDPETERPLTLEATDASRIRQDRGSRDPGRD